MKKSLLRTLLTAGGLLAWRWRTLPRGLYCFNYHRLGDPSSCLFDRGVFSSTAAHFELHVLTLRERFELVNLERLNYYLANPGVASKPLALITFDDGYRDNYELAFPILRRHQASAVFFLPTGFIGTEKIPWWDRIAWLLRHCRKPSLRLPGAAEALELSPARLEDSIRRALRLAKTHPTLSIEEWLAQLQEACGGIQPPAGDAGRLFLNWEEARAMRQAGMDIGSHSHSHEILARLSPQQQERELRQSKEILEAQLQEPVQALAYPVGGPTSYTPQTQALARAAGYKLAFNFIAGVNRLPLANPYEILRLPVDGNPDPAALRFQAAFPTLSH